ncbi:MAG TPA: class A beta-lactamase [Pseudolabrys sp.]|nr:class A beta-lactamase [Pseudolabrys sp.]
MHRINRRALMAASLLGLPAMAIQPLLASGSEAEVQRALAALEQKHGGRLGVAIFDTATTALIEHRGDEQFPLCSTFKLLAVAYVLSRVDRKLDSLHRRITYEKEELVPYSPVTRMHTGEGMTLGALCEAALTVSDNTAANLLLDSYGGPAGLTAHLHSLGDNVTRLDRREPDLNEAQPYDTRDTTTPLAMLETVRKIVLGDALSPASRERLIAWLVAGKTGLKRLRAGVPPGSRVADKTGSGGNNAANDIAVIWPPQRAPVVVTVYDVGSNATEAELSAVFAEIGRLATAS